LSKQAWSKSFDVAGEWLFAAAFGEVHGRLPADGNANFSASSITTSAGSFRGVASAAQNLPS
jgi:hypothetical protein